MSELTTTSVESLTSTSDRIEEPAVGGDMLALVIAWSGPEPGRAGEVALIAEDGKTCILGRGDEGDDRLRFVRQRPAWNTPTAPLGGQGLSRQQLRLRAEGGRIEVERIGRSSLSVDGVATDRAFVEPGATLLLKGQLLLLVTRRPPLLGACRDLPSSWLPAFGEPDGAGLIGESAASWRLRDRIAFVARADTHVLILGESGTGKELAARAIHLQSSRKEGAFVARNAATLPSGLIDAELFGNVKNYPNPGMPERPGLIGQSDGGTLFLDEVGELPLELQSHLLRILDSGGEFHRLGEAVSRRSHLRLVAATNRPASSLKHDFAARLTLQLMLPPLEARRDDIPLLARHLLVVAAERSPGLAARFLDDREGAPRQSSQPRIPRIDPLLLAALLRHRYRTNIRELDALLWQAMAGSPGDTVILTDEVRARLEEAAAATPALEAHGPPRTPAAMPARDPSADEIRDAVNRSRGNLSLAAKSLGVSSRFTLYRLLKKHGIELGKLRSDDK